jgi:predicted nucleic acid-binding protein
MYLVDTNVWLERLLDQDRSVEVQRFLDAVPSDKLFITDFTFHSVGLVLCRLDEHEAFLRFSQDLFVDGNVGLIHIPGKETDQLVSVMKQFDLDFDDAYQYLAAEGRDLILVSFDGDFDRTRRGRKTPSAAIKTS